MDNSDFRNGLSHSWDNLPDLGDVRIFAAVAGLGSFRGAALRLRLPKSTVSRRVAVLEAELRLSLLRRTTRRVTLTAAGENFLKQVLPALSMIGDASRTAREGSKTPSGLLRVTATPNMAEGVAQPLLSLLEENPSVRLECEFTDRHVDLVAEGFDLAVRAGNLADSTLRVSKLGHGSEGYFASPAYLKAHRPIKAPRDLAEHECIVFSGSSRQTRWRFQRGGKPMDVTVRWRVRANSVIVVRDAAVRGLGVAWLPGIAAQELVAQRALAPVLRDFWPPPFPLQVVYPSSRHLAPQVRAAVDALTKRLRR